MFISESFAIFDHCNVVILALPLLGLDYDLLNKLLTFYFKMSAWDNWDITEVVQFSGEVCKYGEQSLTNSSICIQSY